MKHVWRHHYQPLVTENYDKSGKEWFEVQRQYRLKGELGRGDFARVELVKNRDTGQLSARKLYISRDKNGVDIYSEADYQNRAYEADLSLRVHEVGEDYILMDVLRGLQLSTWLQANEPALTPRSLMNTVLGYVDLAKELEKAGVPHGDLHAGNVATVKGQGLIALDFGRIGDPMPKIQNFVMGANYKILEKLFPEYEASHDREVLPFSKSYVKTLFGPNTLQATSPASLQDQLLEVYEKALEDKNL